VLGSRAYSVGQNNLFLLRETGPSATWRMEDCAEDFSKNPVVAELAEGWL